MQSPRPTNPYAPTTGTPVGIQQPQGAQPGMDQQTINSILSYFLR
jgi:hypothetical protein